MRKILTVLFVLIGFVANAQYTPSTHTPINKPIAPAGAFPTDARSYYYDAGTFTYRPYASTAEVLSYLNTTSKRSGRFPIFVTVSGIVKLYMFKDGTADGDLVEVLMVTPADLNAKQNALTLTTTGTSGAATLSGSTLNIPNYATGGSAAWGGITGTLSAQTDLQTALNGKQSNLTLTTTGTSGAATLIGSTLNIPNYTVSGSAASWGSISGTLSAQTDLQTALNAKQNTLSLTTTGSSGPATLSGSTLNIPQYTGGSSTTLKSDLGRLPKIVVDLPAQGIANSGTTVTNYPVTSLDSNTYYFTTVNGFTTGSKYGGVLWNTPIGDSMMVSAPFGIVYGSSFSEGHRDLHGRLHYPGGSWNPNYPDSPGQMSWHLRQLTGYRWYNHGIGGQTTTQARQRWNRDVLAQYIAFSPDGRPNQTLTRKPFIVFFDGAGNDPYTAGMTPEMTMANIEWMAASAQQNNIRFIVCNSPQGPGVTVAGNAYLARVNKWLESGALDKYGTVVFDLRRFWSDPAWGYDGVHGNPTLVNNVDQIHFFNTVGTGYDSLSREIVRTCKIPILKRVAFINKIAPTNPVTNYAYVNALTIDGIAHSLTKQSDTIAFVGALKSDSIWIKATGITTVAGAGTQYGYGHIDWVFDNQDNSTDSFYTRKTMMFGSGNWEQTVARVTILSGDGADPNPILRVMNSTMNQTDYSLAVTSQGRVYINQFGGLTTYNSAALNVTGGIGATGAFWSSGQTHQLGNFQFLQNSAASATGTGISIFNTSASASRMWFQTTSGGNNYQVEFMPWTTPSVGWQTNSNSIWGGVHIKYNLGNATSFGQSYYQNVIDPTYNQTSSNTDLEVGMISYTPTLTSLTNTRHVFARATSGSLILGTAGKTTNIMSRMAYINGSVGINKDSIPYAQSVSSQTVLMIDTTTGQMIRTAANIVSNSDKLVVINDADYTIAAGVTDVVYSNLTTGRTVTLPSASSNTNRRIKIKHGGGGSSTITISPAYRQNSSTTATSVIINQWIELVSDGTDWYLVGNN